MKATLATIVLTGCTAEKLKTSRKVPPRHPLNRLARLQKFGFAFNDAYFSSSDAVARTIENFTTNMKNSFERDNCGFYDANMKPHGGPDPNPDVRESGRPRNEPNGRRRRDADGNDWLFNACQTGNFDGLSDAQVEYYTDAIISKMMCEEDDESSEQCEGLDEETCEYHGVILTVRGSNKGKTNARLSDKPDKAVKQITTGLRKWAERYLNNCHGMRKDEVPRKRARGLYRKWLNKYEEEN